MALASQAGTITLSVRSVNKPGSAGRFRKSELDFSPDASIAAVKAEIFEKN